jgi:hypothetical protein
VEIHVKEPLEEYAFVGKNELKLPSMLNEEFIKLNAFD